GVRLVLEDGRPRPRVVLNERVHYVSVIGAVDRRSASAVEDAVANGQTGDLTREKEARRVRPPPIGDGPIYHPAAPRAIREPTRVESDIRRRFAIAREVEVLGMLIVGAISAATGGCLPPSVFEGHRLERRVRQAERDVRLFPSAG